MLSSVQWGKPNPQDQKRAEDSSHKAQISSIIYKTY